MHEAKKTSFGTASGIFVKERVIKKWLAHVRQPFFTRSLYGLLVLFARRRAVCRAVVLLVVNLVALIVLAMINLLPFLMG
jgi:hypothetical protein